MSTKSSRISRPRLRSRYRNTRLRGVLTENDRTRPLLGRTVQLPSAELELSALPPGDMFYRQLKFAEFDLSEMSLSSLTIATANGGTTSWLALPIFTTRDCPHTGIMVHEDSALTSPAQLKGKRVGVLEYQQTSVIWIRGILHDHFGIRDTDLEWFMERAPERSHGGTTGFRPPGGIAFQYVDPQSSLGAMLTAGAIDAILFNPFTGDLIDQRLDDGNATMRTRPLFADPPAEARRYRASGGVLPANHAVIIRRSIAERVPTLPAELYEAFVDANPDPDAIPYGEDQARPVFETLARYLVQQRLSRRLVAYDELFGPKTVSAKR